MKRILSLVMAVIMVLCVFSACGASDEMPGGNFGDGKATSTGGINDLGNAGIIAPDSNWWDETAKETAKKPESSSSSETGKNNNNNNNNNNNDTEPSESGYTRIDNKIWFGSYPQTEVTDSTLKSTLNSKAGTLPTSGNSRKWTSYGYYLNGVVTDYMWYIDVENGTDKYRGVYFTEYRSRYTTSSTELAHQSSNGYDIGVVYWFKYEPLSWTILAENESAGHMLIFCDALIDSQEYYTDAKMRTIDGEIVYPNNYEHSTIRKWLNETFYNTAFDQLEQELILTTTVDNSVASTESDTNEYVCNDTRDKIFMLSYEEATNTRYGFDSNAGTSDVARQKKATDYAQAQGTYVGWDNCGWWWLRSPYSGYYGYVRSSNVDGDILEYYDYNVFSARRGVVPALRVKYIKQDTVMKYVDVRSDSMAPLINAGDKAVIEKADANDIKVGDIIALYDPDSYNNSIIIRRVVQLYEYSGVNYIVVAGDNDVLKKYQEDLASASTTEQKNEIAANAKVYADSVKTDYEYVIYDGYKDTQTITHSSVVGKYTYNK